MKKIEAFIRHQAFEPISEELQRIAHHPQQCVLVVTHDPSVAARCDRIVFLKDGVLERELQPTSVEEVAGVLVGLSSSTGQE